MGGDRLKTNFVTWEHSKRKICPMCIVRDQQEIPMQIHEVSKTYVCPECGYDVPVHLEPITDTTLEAGNAPDLSRPYHKSVSFPRKRDIRNVSDKFNSASDAWQSD